jgi:preprotein translocase subunit SecG
MNIVLTLLQVIQILAAVGMIGLILMQHGKGADAGAAFGGGGAGSASLFGASGGVNFLSRTTAILATVFLVCTLGLAYFGNLRTAPASSGSVLESTTVPSTPQQAPGAAGAPATTPSTPSGGTGAAQIPGQ